MNIPHELMEKLQELDYITHKYIDNINSLSLEDDKILEDFEDSCKECRIDIDRNNVFSFPDENTINLKQSILKDISILKNSLLLDVERIQRNLHFIFGNIEDGKYERCDFCHRFYLYGYISEYKENDKSVAGVLRGKKICDLCLDDEEKFFRCEKCQRLLTADMKNKEYESNGSLCINCTQPIGFPETIYHAMDASNDLDGLAFNSLKDVQRQLGSPDGDWLDYSDLTELTLLKHLDKTKALYEDANKNQYIVEELDFNGVGNLTVKE